MRAKKRLLIRLQRVLERLEHTLPAPPLPPDWENCIAFQWRGLGNGQGYFQPVRHPHPIRLDELHGIDAQRAALTANTRQFVHGFSANNALLWGAKGTGKSSLIKALLNEYAPIGLRLVEINKHNLLDLPQLVEIFVARPERFILFCDDLSFSANEPGYQALKSALDGSIAAPPENVLIYATSNRRHLLPEYQHENQEAHFVDDELHQGDSVEEKISLSERFGLWLSFYPFGQEAYLNIVQHWLQRMECPALDWEETQRAALQWALTRGTRSGRAAWQFAKDWTGRAREAQTAQASG